MYKFYGGTTIGSSHLAHGLNNQDGYKFANMTSKDGHVIQVGFVCDGCSVPLRDRNPMTKSFTEVGARISASMLLNITNNIMSTLETDLVCFEAYLDMLLEQYIVSVQAMSNIIDAQSVSADVDANTMNRFFLHTVVGVMLTPETMYCFWIGDGYYGVNEKLYSLQNGPRNAPSFPLFHLNNNGIKFNYKAIPIAEVNNGFIGTDGVEYLINTWDNSWKTNGYEGEMLKSVSNMSVTGISDMLKGVNLSYETIDIESLPLYDDTTLIIFQREKR